MTAEQFAYWLQGFMEVADPIELDSSQTAIIKDHLALVFNKQTPDRTVPGVPANPTWSQPTMPQWQEPNIVIEPSKLTPICAGFDPSNPDSTKKFC
jgi:hypothetical protein